MYYCVCVCNTTIIGKENKEYEYIRIKTYKQ